MGGGLLAQSQALATGCWVVRKKARRSSQGCPEQPKVSGMPIISKMWGRLDRLRARRSRQPRSAFGARGVIFATATRSSPELSSCARHLDTVHHRIGSVLDRQIPESGRLAVARPRRRTPVRDRVWGIRSDDALFLAGYGGLDRPMKVAKTVRHRP